MRRQLLKGVVFPTPIAYQVPDYLVAFIVAILQCSSKVDPFEDQVLASRQTDPSCTAFTTELFKANDTGKFD